MRKRRRFRCSLSLLLLLLAACSEAAGRRGAAGESCTSAGDCARELACIAQVCSVQADAGGSVSEAAAVGTSCGTRRDCAAGLACLSNVCQPMSLGQSDVGTRYSGRGESCRAKNDCAAPLGCVQGSCQAVNIPLAHTMKSCHRVECATREDCCAGFVPNEKCAVYKENCETDPIFCNTYRSLCECKKDCVAEQCVAEPPGCQNSAECTSAQTPFCLEGKCRECELDAGCKEEGQKCVKGQCIAACTLDEQCPALHSCVAGVCNETGCKTQRECVFLSKSARAICRAGKCQTPCEVDTDCASEKETEVDFQVCEQGQCVFVGCESNAECRALLSLEDESGLARAVCK
jgi:hypothetical protein